MKKSLLLKVVSILVVASAIIFFSCRQDSHAQPIDTVKVKTENPFAFVGQFHNEGLDYIDSIKQTSKAFTPQMVFNAAKTFAIEKGYQTDLKFEDIRKRIVDDNGVVITDHKALFKKLKQTEQVGVSLRSVNKLDIVESFLDTLSRQQELASAFAYISAFEEKIESSSYSNEEKQYFQMVTATASSSLQYWSQNYDGYRVSGGNSNQVELRGRCGIGCWLCVAFWDTIGAAIGVGTTWTPVGAIVGGVVLSAAARCCPNFCSSEGCGDWLICSFGN